jgi:spore maturation protein SpmB
MLAGSIKNGFISGLGTCWFLIKIIIPVYLFITVLKNTPAMDWLTKAFAPLMGVFHMPGEAAVPIISGMLLDEYGVIAAIKAVGLTGFSVTVVALMTLIAHSLIVEAAIAKKMGLSVTFFTLYRLIASILAGFALSLAGVALNLW